MTPPGRHASPIKELRRVKSAGACSSAGFARAIDFEGEASEGAAEAPSECITGETVIVRGGVVMG